MEELIAGDDDSEGYIPRPLETEQERIEWAGVPEEDFSNPSLWLHRALLKRNYQISERSYFRWLKSLRSYGLERYLPALTDWKVKLFYKPDVEAAVAGYLSEHQRRKRNTHQEHRTDQEHKTDVEAATTEPNVAQLEADPVQEPTQKSHDEIDALEMRMLNLVERIEQLQVERLTELREINERFKQLSADQEALRLSIEALRQQLERIPVHTEATGGIDFFARALQIIADMAKTHEAAILATTGRLTIDLAPLKAILKRAEELSLPKKPRSRR